MSFSVKAVESPSPQLSPYVHPYVSPQVLPQPGQRVPAMSLGDDHGPAKRVGTDPTKYKTTICRNWEQTGTCTFRGCTFAHGVEELRAPTRIDHSSTPLIHSQYVSPGNTPPLLAANGGAHHFGNGGPPKLESLLELLQSEVSRERELVQVHVEANRTLESMLRREQAQHEETRSLLEERSAEYLSLVEVVNRQNALLQSLLQQPDSGGVAGISSSGSTDGQPSAATAQALVERAGELLGDGNPLGIDRDVAKAFPAGIGAQDACGQHGSSSNSSDAGDTKETEKERIEELLRVLQQP